jgi:hypothetical protein
MCADPNKQAAELEKQKKDFAFHGNQVKYINSAANWEKNNQRIGMGLSRTYSDIYAKAKQAEGIGRLYAEKAYKEAQAGQPINEGGRSRSWGRNQTLALLAKTSDIENQIRGVQLNKHILGRGAEIQYQSAMAQNRAKLGLKPQYGMPAIRTYATQWERLQPALDVAKTAASFAMGMPNVSQGTKDFLKPFSQLS